MGKLKYYNLGYCEMFVFDEYIINQVQEGATISPDNNKDLIDIIEENFSEKPLVYITNRYFSYSVDPITYKTTSEIKNLLGVAVVSFDKLSSENALYERKFYNKNFEIFSNINDAIKWAHELVSKNKD